MKGGREVETIEGKEKDRGENKFKFEFVSVSGASDRNQAKRMRHALYT